MNKIQIQTVKQTCDVQVIGINAYFITKAIKAQIAVETAVENAKRNETRYNDETKKIEDVLDENGNKIIKYNNIEGKLIAEKVLPFLTELVNAFEGNDAQ